MAAPRALPYERRVLRHMLESCDWLASRGLGGLKKLRELAAQREANDGGMGHPLVTLPKGWARGVPLHGAAMNGHVATTLPYFRCAGIPQTRRGGAAAAPWIFRGDESRRRRGCAVDIPRRRVAAATPRLGVRSRPAHAAGTSSRR